jgi:cyclopropane fatty-acyl-phospholipid synthase-like methyltransferase
MERIKLTKEEFYKKERNFYLSEYWKNNENNLFRPNGFQSLPDTLYRAFAEQIDKNGKVLDLGCGNGLMLKYLISTSGYKLVPYGADFMEKSIWQAKNILFPEYADNFKNCNVVDYNFKEGPFDFIFTFINHVYPAQRKKYIEKIIKSCKRGGKIIFYEYADVLRAKSYSWVGDIPEINGWKLVRKDYPELSLGILSKI